MSRDLETDIRQIVAETKSALDSSPRTAAASTVVRKHRLRLDRNHGCGFLATPIASVRLPFEMSMPRLGKNGRSETDPGEGCNSGSARQPSGVFGVDSGKRINLWNESVASITGVVVPSSSQNENASGNDSSDDEVLGRPFESIFPSSSFSVSTTTTTTTTTRNEGPSAATTSTPASMSLSDLLETVFRTGRSTKDVAVAAASKRPSVAGRKRTRDEMGTGNNARGSPTATKEFVIDLLPQFEFGVVPSEKNGTPTTNNDRCRKRRVTGVVFVVRNHHTQSARRMSPRWQDNNNSSNNNNNNGASSFVTPSFAFETTARSLISIAHSISMPPKSSILSSVSESTSLLLEETETYQTTPMVSSVSLSSSTASISASTVSSSSHGAASAAIENSSQLFRQIPTPPLCELQKPRLSVYETPPAPPSHANPNNDADSNKDNQDKDYRTLFETVDAILFGVDRTGRINEWNHKMEDLTGIPKETAMGRSLLDDSTFLPIAPACATMNRPAPTLLRETFAPVLSEACRGRSTSQLHLAIQHRSKSSTPNNTAGKEQQQPRPASNNTDHGQEEQEEEQQPPRNEPRHIIANGSPRYDAKMKVVGAVFVACDVTECFTEFLTIKTTANELRKLIDTANAPIFGIDANGYVNEWNDKTAEITGYGKEDAFGCLLVDTFIFPDIRNSVRAIFEKALNDGKGTSNYELEFRTKSNEIRHLLVNITPQCDMNNKVVGVVIIAQDVTEAVKRDRAVASMALELRQLIDTANAPIFGIDVVGKVNEWNTRMSDITGFAKEEAHGIPLVENFIAKSMKERVGEILEAALIGNETSNYELEVISKTGEPIFLLVNATTRRDPDSNVIGVVGVAQDVTEDRKHAKALREMQTLRASQEAKVETERNMTAYFAHELRNPLGAIDSALAAMPDNLPSTADSLVSGMRLCTKFMSSIMNNLLDVRKMEEGKMRLGKEPISIRKLLHNVHKMLSPSVRMGVEFRKLINVKGNDWVLGDAHRIEQVLTNVVSNAIKYTVSGHVQVSIEWEDNMVKFVCEDTGPGIPKSEQEKLFQRFVQRGGAPGTGLGLAIAKHIVDLTEGSIRFESDPSIKAGTTCIVLMALPLCKKPESAVVIKKDIIQEPISVLIIDDIKMNRTMMRRRIKKGIAPNARIQEAATGEEALLICGKDKFDVMIVDQFMEEAGGVMVGTDVVFAMRRMRIDSILIGCSGNDIGSQFFDAGADMVWQKPMPSNDKIIEDLRTSLDKKKEVAASVV